MAAASIGDGIDVVPAGIDYCADPLIKLVLLGTRDTGRGLYLPYPADGQTWLARC